MKMASNETNLKAYSKSIRDTLDKQLPTPEAVKLAALIDNTALTVDLLLAELLGDPELSERYDYDGQFFTPKDRWGFHRVFDGEHIVRSTEACLNCFLEQPAETRAAFLEEFLATHVFEVQARLTNWKEYRTLHLIPLSVIEEIVKAEKASEPAPLSESEREFFKVYESQLKVRES